MNRSVLSDDAEFARAFQAKMAEAQEELNARLSREVPGWLKARAWLALVPAWTDQLAEACGFPLSKTTLKKFLQKTQQAGLCAQSESLDAKGSKVLHFWMPESMRAAVLDELREEDGRQGLLSTAVEIGERILEAVEKKGVQVSALVTCWAEVATHTREGLNEGAQYLIRTVGELVRGEKQETGQALTWLNAGKSLAQAFGGSLESAVRVGEHRIELAYRQEQDERHLKHFLPRQEQIEDFHYLLNNQDGVWALHYVGMGGVGKTMMLRNITARLAPEANAPTSRVDFDYLSPDYPVRRPGQLLLELAAELRAYITTERQEFLYNYFQNQAVALHESLSGEPSPDNPLNNIRSQDFKRMLSAFCDFLSLLPQPLVLILDTCEELAKVQLSGSKLPTIEATFEILEQMHLAAPSVRFIFAGRRLLARAGNGWRVAGGDVAEGKIYLPERKDYLRVHEIRGFDAAEANDYFTKIEKLKLRASLRQAILQRSRDTGIVGKLIWTPARRAVEGDRYNPFDLSLYAEWVKEDSTLNAATIKSGQVDPYVETRIVQRIRNADVRAALPAIVLLRRFNREMLLPALSASGSGFEEIYRELNDQEWIEHQRDESLETSFLEINRNLYDRLDSYYRHSSRLDALERARESLWPNLARLVEELPLRKLSTDHVDAALRLAPTERAAALWDDLNRRITLEADWSWARRVTERILGEDGAVSKTSPSLFAAVRATYASSLLHENTDLDDSELWREIAEFAARHPDPKIRRWLRQRSTLKRLGTFGFREGASRDGQQLAFRQWVEELGEVFNKFAKTYKRKLSAARQYRREQLVASFCAALEAVLERTDPDIFWDLKAGDVICIRLPEQLRQLDVSDKLLAFACSLTGRALARKGRWREAVEMMDEAAKIIKAANEDALPSQRWEDWRAPASLSDRIRLEALCTIPPKIKTFPPSDLEVWRSEAMQRLDQIDAERLVSCILALSLTKAPEPLSTLQALSQAEKYDLNRQPVCAAHRAVPPLFVFLALGSLALGMAQEALDYLAQRTEAALNTRGDQATLRAAEFAKLHVIRRMRLHSKGIELINRLARSDNPSDVLCVRELLAVNSSLNPEALLHPSADAPAPHLHAWWRGQLTLTQKMARAPVEQMRTLGHKKILGEGMSEREDSAGHFAQLKVDWQEASILAKKFNFAPLSNPGDFTFSGEDWWSSHPTHTEQALRLIIRAGALRGTWDFSTRLLDKVGPRLVAELALEEGELLALRLPLLAVPLLDKAYALFCDAHDLIGAFITMQLSTIADIHSGNVKRAQERIEKTLTPIYERLTTADPELKLPSWPEIDAISKEPTAESLDRLGHPSWGGWLQRLVRCLVWLAESKGKGERTTRVRQWLAKSYGKQLPLELALGRGEMGTSGSGVMVTPLARRVWRDIWPLFGCTILGMLMFIIIALISGFMVALNPGFGCLGPILIIPVIYVIIAGLKWLRDARGISIIRAILSCIAIWAIILFLANLIVSIFVDNPNLKSLSNLLGTSRVGRYGLVVVLGIAVIAGLRFLLRKPIDSWLAARTEIALQIQPESALSTQLSNSNQNISVPVIINLRQRLLTASALQPIPQRAEWEETKNGWQMPDLGPYRKAAIDIPLQVANEFTKLSERLRKRHLPVALRIERALAFFPWEAVLSLALPPAKSDAKADRLQFWRSGDALPQSAAASWQAEEVQVVGNKTWGLMVESGWKPLTSALFIRDNLLRLDATSSRKVLHLIGQPVNTSAGLRLQLSGNRMSTAQSTRPLSSEGPSARSATATEEEALLLGTENLPLNSTALVVVQAEPVLDLTPRLQTDREQSAKLRAYAADVFAAGAQAVIVLPTLPPEIAEEVLKRLAKGLAEHPQPGLRTLLNILDQMRHAIQHWNSGPPTVERVALSETLVQLKEGPPETRLEMALDVCLYARIPPTPQQDKMAG